MEDKPPRPSSARAAKARRVELTMRRLLVKLANRNLKALTIQTHKNADKYVGHPPRVSLLGILIKDDIIVAGCHGLCLNFPDLDVTDHFTRTSYHNYDGGAVRELHTRRQNTAGPGRGESAKMSGDMQ